MTVDLADEQQIDPFDDTEDDFTAWAEYLNESHGMYIKSIEQKIVDQRRHQNRDRHTDDEQNEDQQNRDQKNDDQQNKDKNQVNQHVRNQQNSDQPALPDDNDRFNFKDGDDTEMSQMDMSAPA